MAHPLLVLVGPTAVGKTALSLELARRFNGEIVSAYTAPSLSASRNSTWKD